MILNERQASTARRDIQMLSETLRDCDPNQRPGMLGALEDLEAEVSEYEALRRGMIDVVSINSFADVPAALVQARIARRWTQRDLAARLGVTEQMVQKDESGGYERASLARLASIAAVLGVDLSGGLQFVGEPPSAHSMPTDASGVAPGRSSC